MKRILFVHNSIPDYRIPLFSKLANYPEFDCNFIIFGKYNVECKQKINCGLNSSKFEFIIFKKYSIIRIINNFLKIRKKIINGNYDMIIFDAPTYPEIMLLNLPLISKIFFKNCKPFVKIIWDEEFEWNKSFKRKIVLPLSKYLNKNADAILVPTKLHKKWQIKLNVDPKKIILFPNVTNIYKKYDEKKIKRICQKYGLNNKSIITYVGRLVPIKGVKFLIEAYFQLISENENLKKDTVLMIVGDGEDKNKLIKIAKKINEAGGNVIFTGHINNSDLSEYYEISKFGVVPSVNISGTSEAYGLVVNEFLVYGKPVLVSNVVGASALIVDNPEFGHIFKEKNIKDIKNNLKMLLDIDPKSYQIRSKIIQKNIKIYNNYEVNLEVIKNLALGE
ncbi:glycosyltransferase involved in cell wall biosynthesis [Methanococcus maripaludis]|uniref:Glycosyltransferase involved in cell wall biosynthesis n=1 Tax=Methanococcus maripaludis TaxID=39152 RepID=A0A7J9NGY4_METMI|nr:glycosyltransferase family 4 protein [Methanococcus maripaludis]MBA2840126.1 glycosyltransferase involved in cell wall biosynthesis [Methanococcus maripaludis]